MFCSNVYNFLEKNLAKKTHNAYFERPILYILDELGNLPKMSFIPKIYTIGRGKNIFVLGVVQSIHQLMSKYNQYVAKTIFENSGAILITGLQDLNTAEQLSRMAGSKYYEKTNKSYDKDYHTRGFSTSHQKERLIDPSFFIQKEANEMIVCLQRTKPYKFTFTPFYKTETLKKIETHLVSQNLKIDENQNKYTASVINTNFFDKVVPVNAKLY